MRSAAPPGVAGRLHQTPRGATARAAGRAGPSRQAGRPGPGRVSSGRGRAHASGRRRRGLLLLPQPARGLLTCASSPPAPKRPPLPAAPHGAARPRPPGPRVGEEERRLRNRQPPPVPQPPPAPPGSPPRRGRPRGRDRRRHNQWERRLAGDAPSLLDGQRLQPIAGGLAAGGGHVAEA